MQIGQIVMVQGFEFEVTACWIDVLGTPVTRVWRFVGKLTASPENAVLRGTAYDGGTYGGPRVAD